MVVIREPVLDEVIAQMLSEEKLGASPPEATCEGDRYRASDAKPSRNKTDAIPEVLLPSVYRDCV